MAKQKYADLPLGKLLLDNDNPRHDPIDNEPEIIAQLLKEEQVLPLAKSIAAKKAINPFGNVGVLKHPKLPGHYLVVEGNRRVCALKLLKDPARAPTSKLKATFEELKQQAGRLPDEIHVALVDNEADADYWKAIQHHGEQGGVGTRAWSPQGKARHAAKVGGGADRNRLAIDLVAYAAKSGLITEAERDAISVTTVTRYIKSEVVREALGLASASELKINAPDEEFEAAVGTFLKDAVPRTGEEALVNSRSKNEDRLAYVAEFRRKGHAVKSRLSKASAPRPTSKAGRRNSRSPDRRPHVVPAEFKAQIRNTVLKHVFDELRRIDPTYSFAAGYLLRAFIEQLAHQYAADHGLGLTGELHQIIGRCARHLEKANASAKVLKPLRVMESDRNSRLSPDSLGAWVHGSEIPTPAELKRRWDSLQAAFRALLDGLK